MLLSSSQRNFHSGHIRRLFALLSATIAFLFVAFLIVDELDAKGRGSSGSGFRGGSGRGSGGGYGGFRKAPTFRPPPVRQTPNIRAKPAPPRLAPRQSVPGRGKAPQPRLRQKSFANPQSPVASLKGLTGQTTRKGSPIIQTTQGKRYAIPLKGVSTSLKSHLSGSSALTGSFRGYDLKKLGSTKKESIGKGGGGGARNTPVAQKILRELKNHSHPELTRQEARQLWREIMDSGRKLPDERVALPGSHYHTLYKIVPASTKGPSNKTPYWITEGQLKYLRQNPKQLQQMLGLPKSSKSENYQVYAIRPESGRIPNVYVGKVGVTYEKGQRTEGGGDQVIVPNRKLWAKPTLIGDFP